MRRRVKVKETNRIRRIIKTCMTMGAMLIVAAVTVGSGQQVQAKTRTSVHTHSYSAATCTTAAKCSCGLTKGSALGHSYSSATCTKAVTCTRCGSTKGSSLGHSYSVPTCTQDGKCTRCGALGASKLGHLMKDANCENPSKCTRSGCSYYIGQPKGHHWVSATCIRDTYCDRCGKTTPNTKLQHNYSRLVRRTDATCANEGGIVYECVCGSVKTERIPKDTTKHNYVISSNGCYRVCSICGNSVFVSDYSLAGDVASVIVDKATGNLISNINNVNNAVNLANNISNGSTGDILSASGKMIGGVVGGGSGEFISEFTAIAGDAKNKSDKAASIRNSQYDALDKQR